MDEAPKQVIWIGSSRDDLKSFPKNARNDVGIAVYAAQKGAKHPSSKPLKGFGGAGVLEVIANHDGDAFRAVYTVRFAEAICVLHCFQKKIEVRN